MDGEPIDIVAGIPLLVGIVGSATDAAAPTPALAAAVADQLRELRGRAPQTPLVVITPLAVAAEIDAARAAAAAGIPIVACVAAGNSASVPAEPAVRWTKAVAGDVNAYVALTSDVLFVVSHAACAPSDLHALAVQRTSGEPRPAGRPLLAAADAGPCATIAGSIVTWLYPSADDDRTGTQAFAEAIASRNQFNVDLAAAAAAQTGTPIERLRSRIAVVTGTLQDRTNLSQRTLYLLAFAAAAAQIVIPGGHGFGVYLKYFPVAIAFIIYFFVRRRRFQSRYQDYRAISEALRVQAAWSSIGIHDSVDEGYLPMQQTDLQWIRNVLRVVHALDPQPDATGLDAVRRWVASQRNYFAGHSRSEARARDRINITSSILGAVSVAASLAALAFAFVPGGGEDGGTRWLKEALGVAAGLSALLVAVARSYLRTRGHTENANRYERMFHVFDRALRVIDGAPADLEQGRAVAGELGRLALSEHAEWLLGQRERPIALVTTSAA